MSWRRLALVFASAVALLGCSELLGFADFLPGITDDGGADAGTPPDREAADADVHVSPDGDDANDGTRERPLRTVAKALADASTLLATKERVRVALCDGDYEESELVVRGGVEVRGGYECGSWLRAVAADGVAGTTVPRVSRLSNREPAVVFIDVSSTEGRSPPLLDGLRVLGRDLAATIGITGSATLSEVTVTASVSAAALAQAPAATVPTVGAIRIREGSGVTRIEHCNVLMTGTLPGEAGVPRQAAVAGIDVADGTVVARRNLVVVSSVVGICNGVLSGRSTVDLLENSLATIDCVAAFPDSSIAAVAQAHGGSVVRSIRNAMHLESPGRLDPTRRATTVGIRSEPYQEIRGELTSDGDKIAGPDLVFAGASTPLAFQAFRGDSLQRVTNASVVLNASTYTLAEAVGVDLTAPRDQVLAHNTFFFVGSSFVGDAGPAPMSAVAFAETDGGAAAVALEANLVVSAEPSATFVRARCGGASGPTAMNNRWAGVAPLAGAGCGDAGLDDLVPDAGDMGNRGLPCPPTGCGKIFVATSSAAVRGDGLRPSVEAGACALDLRVPTSGARDGGVANDGSGAARRPDMTTAGALEILCE